MELEDYLGVKKPLRLVAKPAHTVSMEGTTIFIERTKLPKFKAVVSTDNSVFNILDVEWIDEKPYLEVKVLELKQKAKAFLQSYYFSKTWL